MTSVTITSKEYITQDDGSSYWQVQYIADLFDGTRQGSLQLNAPLEIKDSDLEEIISGSVYYRKKT